MSSPISNRRRPVSDMTRGAIFHRAPLVRLACLSLATAGVFGVQISYAQGNRRERAVASSGRASAAPSSKWYTRRQYTLTTAENAHWAAVAKRTAVFSAPSVSARRVTTLQTITGDHTQNIVLVLSGAIVGPTNQSWYRIRLAILPNNSTGWVPRAALGSLYAVDTHLYVDLETTTAILKRNGLTVFSTIVGVGRSYWPTPRGQFYIRDKLGDYDDPFYGPVAFGTSARSTVLTAWPGGGYIGVHGTDEPQSLPGHVSHGCIRMPNASILALARLMPVGTPLTIT
jgi:lipoprotein-anchoring transpeptidase ErfK/SrfK